MRLPIRGRDILVYSNVDNPSRDSDSGDFYGNTKGENRHHGDACGSASTVAGPGRSSASRTKAPSVTHRLSPGDRERLARAGSTCSSMSMQGNFPFGSLRFNLSWLLQGKSTGDGTIPEEFSSGGEDSNPG